MPHYPVLQPDGLLAVWSTIVDHFTAFDCSVEEATDKVSKWHTGDVLSVCQKVAAGEKPFDHFGDWDDCVGQAVARHGEENETVKMALERTTDRRIIDLIVAVWRAEKRADEAEYEAEHLRTWIDAVPVEALRRQYSQDEMTVYDFGLDAQDVVAWLERIASTDNVALSHQDTTP